MGYLDGAGVRFLWGKIKDYIDKKFSQIEQAPAGEDGKSAYQYAVDGGYTGTEEEFIALLGSGPWLPTDDGSVKELSIGNYVDSSRVYLTGIQTDLEADAILSFVGGYLDARTRLANIAEPQDYSDAANKQYVDNLFSQMAPVIVEVQIISDWGKGSTSVGEIEVYKRYNVKCYPADTNTLAYSINFSLGSLDNSSYYPSNTYVRIIPPAQYAFTGLYGSVGMAVSGANNNFMYDKGDGTTVSWFPVYVGATITGSFTLEVA